MSAAQAIADFASKALRPILDESGYVLYSAANSLKPCPVYLLGSNPGGSPEDHAEATVRASINALPTKTINNYLDEAWGATQKSWQEGEAPLQQRVVWLLEQLGLSPRKVPCSNLIFVRSKEIANLPFNPLADLCWKVHEQIIEIVSPEIVMVFGNSRPSPYTYLYEKFSPTAEKTFPSGHGNWSCRSFKANGVTVIGLPHLSRYKVIGKSEVINWIKEHNAV